ncbi:hypothetical protein [Paenibacillus sp. FSL R5-192]|uniref:hypothetical protein n=1 Tax=Paenibacillus sp. FSL R5-192 TaxID=1226754 RepID=UPI001F2FD992|nr:hypothetical protein [Paenibacillus sp. FSL R5-192]
MAQFIDRLGNPQRYRGPERSSRLMDSVGLLYDTGQGSDEWVLKNLHRAPGGWPRVNFGVGRLHNECIMHGWPTV